jgi:hypothetical protein
MRLLLVVLAAAACAKGGESAKGGDTAAAPATTTPTGGGAWAVTGSDARATLFLQKGCPQCHSISALGVKSTAEVGPDLTRANADVRSRFGVELPEFLERPTGTMQVVLSSMVKLSPAERDSVVRILRQLHEEGEEHEERGERTQPKQ